MLPNHQPLVLRSSSAYWSRSSPAASTWVSAARRLHERDPPRARRRKDAVEDFESQIRELLGYFTGTQRNHPQVHARPGEGLRVPPYVLALAKAHSSQPR